MQKNPQIPAQTRIKNLEISQTCTFNRSKYRSISSAVSAIKYETRKNFTVMRRPEGVVVKRLS